MTEIESQDLEIPRAKRPNPFNYDNLQFAVRDKAVRDMEKDFPTVPQKWLEWLYDTIENKPKDEVERIIKEGLWEKNIKERMGGGVIKDAMQVFSSEAEMKEYDNTFKKGITKNEV